MEIFQLHRQYMAIMGLGPLQSLQSNPTLNLFVRRLLVFISFSLFVILSSVYLGYEAKTLNEYADSFYGFATATTGFAGFAILLWKMDSLSKLIGDFEKLIEKRMGNPESNRTYVKLNENIEKWTGIFYIFLVQVTCPAVVVPQFITSFYLYFTTDLGTEAFSLPLPIWAPFDWRTPTRYFIIFTFESSAVFCVCHFCLNFIGSFVASCFIIFTFANEIKNEIHVLNECNKAKANSVELMKGVGNIVEFHAAAKQLISDINNVFAFIIIIEFLWSLSTICSTLLVVQTELEQNVNPLELIDPICRAFWSFARLFLICEFGQMLTDHFDQFTNVIYDCDWTSFPKEIQKILPIIIQNTQREVVLETFKNASCSRESFKKVVNGGFSYFMVFRKFQ